MYNRWDDDHVGNDKKVMFAKPPLIIVPMLEKNVYSESEANKKEPVQETGIGALEVRPAIVADVSNTLTTGMTNNGDI